MRSRARTAYTLTITSFLLILIGCIIPFWFGRYYESSRSKKQWGLFYVIICEIGRCINDGRILDNDHVDFGGAESPILLEAISVLAAVGMLMCCLGLVIVLLFHCHVCGKSYSYHNYVTSAAVVQFIAAGFIFLTITLSAIATSAFFSVTPMDDIIEFPWSLLFFCLGEVPLIASAVIYLLITCRWKTYRHVYAKDRYSATTRTDQYGNNRQRPSEPLPDYNLDTRYRYKPYNRDSFIGYFRGSREDSRHLSGSRQKGGYFFPDRSPWERSRHYYTYPYKIVNIDKTNYKNKRQMPFSTINSEYRRSRPKSLNRHTDDGFPRVWHTSATWDTSLDKKSGAQNDIYM